MVPNRYIVRVVAIFTMLSVVAPLSNSVFASPAKSSLDLEIESLRKIYSLSKGWDLSNQASSSLSFEYSGLLSQVNRRWRGNLLDVTSSHDDIGAAVKGIMLDPETIKSAQREYGKDAARRLKTWQRISQVSESLPVAAKLKLVNNFFNAIAFRSDQDNWGVSDYWSSPIELLNSNSGDCEDYAIAKYITLAAMGFPIDQMRIVYVKSTQLASAHMVLAIYDGSSKEPLILDNVSAHIVPASSRKDLEPVFGFNG